MTSHLPFFVSIELRFATQISTPHTAQLQDGRKFSPISTACVGSTSVSSGFDELLSSICLAPSEERRDWRFETFRSESRTRNTSNGCFSRRYGAETGVVKKNSNLNAPPPLPPLDTDRVLFAPFIFAVRNVGLTVY